MYMQRIAPHGACLIYTDIVIANVFNSVFVTSFPSSLVLLSLLRSHVKWATVAWNSWVPLPPVPGERSSACVCPAHLGGSPGTSCQLRQEDWGVPIELNHTLNNDYTWLLPLLWCWEDQLPEEKKQFKVIRIIFNCRKQISSATVLCN